MSNILKNLFENKKVAIVGPAKYMTTLKLGKEIDSHDTIVRINRSWESTSIFSNNIGSRTDVLYSCLIEKPANAGVINIEKYIKENIKLVCAPPASSMKGLSTETRFHHLINIEKIKKLSENIPIRLVDHNFHNALAKKVDSRPNTGFVAIYDILRMNPKFLSIYGFSFYLDGFIPGVKKGIINEQNKTEAEFANQCFNSKRHVQKNMWQFAKETLLNNEKVNLDSQLKIILELERLDKSLYEQKK